MDNSKYRRRFLLVCTLLILFCVITMGFYTQASKFQKRQKEHERTYEAAKVTAAPEVRSAIRGLEISGVSLINQGRPEAAIAIDVTNNRDEAVMALDFVAGKQAYSGLRVDGLLEEGNLQTIIPAHTLKTFNWSLSEIMEGQTVFLAAAVFSDGKEEGDKRILDGIKVHRRHFQQKQRDAKAKNGGQY